ncbi:MAG: futalosine hydrolase [Ginsengibacter sp.]
MKILLLAATKMEILPFLKRTPAEYGTHTVEVLIGGIGIASTVFHLTDKLCHSRFDIVIQAGIAGSFTKKIKKGTVVVVARDAFAGPAIEEKDEYKILISPDKEGQSLTNGLLNSNEILKQVQLPVVNALTTDILTDKKNKNKRLQKKFEASIESMEGAAMHYVCILRNVPFLQIRSISNMVGVRDKSKWNIKDAVKNLDKTLNALLQKTKIIDQ